MLSRQVALAPNPDAVRPRLYGLQGNLRYVIWGQLDTFAARFHGGADRYAISVLISTVGWLLLGQVSEGSGPKRYM